MISIIMPVYNGEKYINQAIDSILKQTYKNFELIIVDDGSKDNTAAIIKSYKDDRIKYIQQENSGPGAARNRAMSVAKGKYFAFCDADDVYVENKLELQCEILDNRADISVVFGDYYVTDSQFNITRIAKPEYYSDNRHNMLAYMLFRNIISFPPSIMFRRECYEEGFRYDEKLRINEDYILLLGLLEKYNFYYLPEILQYYRRHSDNLTNNMTQMKNNALTIIQRYSIERIDEILEESDFCLEDKLRLKGKICMRKKEPDIALESFKKIDDVYKTWLDYFYIGNLYYILEDYESAVDNYKKAKSFYECGMELFNNLGCALYKQGKSECAKYFEIAYNMNNKYTDARRNYNNLQDMQECNFTMFELRKI